MTRALDDSKKQSYTLVEFSVPEGSPTAYRFTNWATTIDPGGDDWTATPTIDVKWPKNTGTLQANGCVIQCVSDANSKMAALVELLLADGTPTPAVYVEIREVILPVVGGDQATTLVPFRGRILRAVRNANGRAKRVRFDVQSIKSRLDIPMGLPCNHHCVWAFTGTGCAVQGGIGQRGPQKSAEQRPVTVSSIDGKEITTMLDPSISSPKSFQFGYLERLGVRIGIQDWDPLNPKVFLLRQHPPASWLAQVATAIPGCDKTLSTCQDNWNNEANFGGIGYSILPYNPHFEDGA